jgi:hypothetical protein
MDYFNTGLKLFNLIPTRQGLSSADQAYVDRVGNWPVKTIKIGRTPINEFVGALLSVATVGIWDQKVKKYGVDRVFHLFMVCGIQDPKTRLLSDCVLEKNSTVRVYPSKGSYDPGTEWYTVIEPYTGTINELLDTTEAAVGKGKFWSYDAFQNNCQDFLVDLLGNSNILSPSSRAFIKQPIADIAAELPDYTPGLASQITGADARIRTLTGRGL